MYAIAQSPLVLVGSRFIVGLAAGSTSSILGMISRGTTKNQRTAVLSQIFTGRQAGMVIGPAFNLFLRECNFTIFNLHVGPYNSTGVSKVRIILIYSIVCSLIMGEVEKALHIKRTN